ncbi:hypothetical protein Hdeb2414_s0067g00768621 [Helianthus debilis subsp. tardiflorus]
MDNFPMLELLVPRLVLWGWVKLRKQGLVDLELEGLGHFVLGFVDLVQPSCELLVQDFEQRLMTELLFLLRKVRK